MYATVGNFKYVSEAASLNRPRGEHFLPLVGRPPKGRPKDHKRRKAAVEKAQAVAAAAQHNTNMAAMRRASAAGATPTRGTGIAGAGATQATQASQPCTQV